MARWLSPSVGTEGGVAGALRRASPWYVDLRPGVGHAGALGLGTRRHPFASVPTALACWNHQYEVLEASRRGSSAGTHYQAQYDEEKALRTPRVFVTCGPNCEMVQCNHGTCSQLVCRAHGMGEGFRVALRDHARSATFALSFHTGGVCGHSYKGDTCNVAYCGDHTTAFAGLCELCNWNDDTQRTSPSKFPAPPLCEGHLD